MNRAEAAKIGGMDRPTLRDWVHRFNERGPDGLKDTWWREVPSRLSAAQLARLSTLVETGPDLAVHGVVRWRRIDLKRVISEEFGVDYHERSVGWLQKQLGFSHMSARPRHPMQDSETIAALKKDLPRTLAAHLAGVAKGKTVEIWFQSCPRGGGGRGAHRPEERHGAAMGQNRHAASQARRPALRKRLPLRCDLPGQGRGRGAGLPFADTEASRCTTTRSRSMSPWEHTPFCCLIAQVGIPLASCAGRRT